MWPSDAFSSKVAAKYGQGNTTEPFFVQHEVNAAIDLDGVDGEKGKLIVKYMDYVKKNLLQVKYKKYGNIKDD